MSASAALVNIDLEYLSVGNGHLGNGPYGTPGISRSDVMQRMQTADGNDFYILHGRAAGQAFVPDVQTDIIHIEGDAACLLYTSRCV